MSQDKNTESKCTSNRQNVTYRFMHISDFDDVISLWHNTEGIIIRSADNREEIESYLIRNPDLSFVVEINGSLVGTIMCGHDGRRGYLQHLAIKNEYRTCGTGRELVRLALAGLQKCGISKCHLFVLRDNRSALDFWHHIGWHERTDLVMMSTHLSVE